ncbi:RelA/SpoT domain-containing protein [Xanthomonas arboricola]|uniref:RelA/SpoT domain-containing protein n=1 Tax=Xanthomonas arboricola TaxID=56448 RepID=UPI000CEE7003|nr:hypothetical protein [Xanthomonas arboricola]PPT48504.1 hypothetical protein XarjCFBP7652_11190 [Xanthomonas arboricola]
MLIPAQIEKRRLENLLQEDYVSQMVSDKILTYCTRRGFAYVGRRKKSESLSEKIETGRFKGWSELDDLFACTIVIPTLADEAEVLDFLKKEFFQVECRLRASSLKDPETFRFDATRFVAYLSEFSKEILFEIQIRTAFEHAWSVTTHALAYKGDGVSWRHKRLAAQLRAAVEQLDQLVLGFQEWTAMVTEQQWPETEQKKLIGDFFSLKVGAGEIPIEIVPQSWTRFSENIWTLLSRATGQYRKLDGVFLQESLAMIDEEMSKLGCSGIPKSTSLHQFCLGVLITRGKISKVDKYTAMITPELLSIFPKVADAKINFFDFEFETDRQEKP